MKIRVAFVANSSSSSFLILGIQQDIQDGDEPELYPYEIVEKFRQTTPLDVIQVDDEETECIVGKLIFETSGGGSMTIDTLEQRLADAKVFLEQNGITNGRVYFGETHSG